MLNTVTDAAKEIVSILRQFSDVDNTPVAEWKMVTTPIKHIFAEQNAKIQRLNALLFFIDVEKLATLAERNYPDFAPSGICSAHMNRDDHHHYECETCYPNWERLASEHCEINRKLYEEIEQLKQQLAEAMNSGGEG